MAAIGEREQFQKLCQFCLHIFSFGNMVAVKGISGIKCDNDMWLSPVNCPRCCSSLSCDQGSGQPLDSGGRCWHQKRYFYSTAMFLYSKYSVFHVFFPTVVVGGVS